MTDFVQQCLDFSFFPGFLIFERIGFTAIEIGFSTAWDEDIRQTKCMANSQCVLEWRKTNGSQWSVRDGMGHVQWRCRLNVEGSAYRRRLINLRGFTVSLKSNRERKNGAHIDCSTTCDCKIPPLTPFQHWVIPSPD